MTDILRSSIEVENSPFLAPNEYVLGNHDLPIAKHRAEIEAAISENPVTILVGRTGSGKTTQVPQYAREMANEDGKHLFDEIIVTQPRIVAARTVSERVAEEIAHTEQYHAVGYYTSKERTLAPQRNQDIAFLTDGKAAAQLLHQARRPDPESKRLLLIDEVHEWNLNIELLAAIAREKTDPSSSRYDPNFKVVVMSATMDCAKLQDYFKHVAPPLIEVEVPTYEVKYSTSTKSVANIAINMAAETKGRVLLFLPGKAEINKAIRQAALMKSSAVPMIPLHGQLSAQQQRRAFLDYPDGVVIATTNVSEASLTFSGVQGVVDSAEVRVDQVGYDLLPTGNEGLFLVQASRAEKKQRAGRGGRTNPSKYVLGSPDGKTPPVPDSERQEYPTPAMQRSRLDSMILRLKAVGREINDMSFFHEPPAEALRAAKKRLFVLGAVDKEGNITERGLQMEALPLDPEYACMVAFAYEKDYPQEVKEHVIDIAAIMQLGGILKRAPAEDKWRELLAKDIYYEVRENESDFIAQLEAYTQLQHSVSREDWGRYDIIENAADQVEQGRLSLVERLGALLHQPSPVGASSRQAVMTCINAGQLNQLWRRRGNTWSWALGSSESFELSESSVVTNLGELATGRLFSLGLRKKIIDQIQDANSASLHSLEQVAGHLLTEIIDHSTVIYDADQECVVASVQRKLGSVVLGSVVKPIEVVSDSASKLLREGYRKHAWDTWGERAGAPVAFDIEAVKTTLENPQCAQYGTDPVTGEPLVAWMGGNGQWCQTKEIAIKSLEACQRRLEKAPKEADRRAQKEDTRRLEAELRALKKRGSYAQQATSLLSAKKKLDRKAAKERGRSGAFDIKVLEEWQQQAHKLLENSSGA